MNVGLPGVGIGAIFYLLGALYMPLRELFFLLSGSRRSCNCRLVLVSLLLALGVIAGVGAVYVVLDSVFGLELTMRLSAEFAAEGSLLATLAPIIPLLISVSLLICVLMLVQVLRFTLGRRVPQEAP